LQAAEVRTATECLPRGELRSFARLRRAQDAKKASGKFEERRADPRSHTESGAPAEKERNQERVKTRTLKSARVHLRNRKDRRAAPKEPTSRGARDKFRSVTTTANTRNKLDGAEEVAHGFGGVEDRGAAYFGEVEGGVKGVGFADGGGVEGFTDEAVKFGEGEQGKLEGVVVVEGEEGLGGGMETLDDRKGWGSGGHGNGRE